LVNREDNIEVEDFIKNPIVISNPNNIEVIREKTLQKLILEGIPSFLKELGICVKYINIVLYINNMAKPYIIF